MGEMEVTAELLEVFDEELPGMSGEELEQLDGEQVWATVPAASAPVEELCWEEQNGLQAQWTDTGWVWEDECLPAERIRPLPPPHWEYLPIAADAYTSQTLEGSVDNEG